VAVHDAYEALIEELVQAIELRECGDADGDWSVASRIRQLEQELVEQHRFRPGRWLTTAATAARIGAADEGTYARLPSPVAAGSAR
jgi:hypothetical protein